jgi:hypothetical protein
VGDVPSIKHARTSSAHTRQMNEEKQQMLKQFRLPVLFIGAIAIGSLFMASWAWAAPTSPVDGARNALLQLTSGHLGAPATGSRVGIAGPVSAVNGSTYSMKAGPDETAVVVNVTSSTKFANPDGSSATPRM